jgi:hypothetical protein
MPKNVTDVFNENYFHQKGSELFMFIRYQI